MVIFKFAPPSIKQITNDKNKELPYDSVLYYDSPLHNFQTFVFLITTEIFFYLFLLISSDIEVQILDRLVTEQGEQRLYELLRKKTILFQNYFIWRIKNYFITCPIFLK